MRKWLQEKYYRIKWKFITYCRFKSLSMLVHSDIQTRIPKSTRFGHNGLGIVIGCRVKIGENCIIRQHVILSQSVTIGNNVEINPFTVVYGNIKIGNNVIIGAHSYVNHDIPDNSFGFGIPFKIVKKLPPSQETEKGKEKR